MTLSSYKLAVFGNPVAHSLSPLIHQYFAKHETNIRQITYDKLLVEDTFATSAKKFFEDIDSVGCNVTVPCKFDAYKFVDELTVRAQTARAVNTIIKTTSDNGSIKFIGDNTDGDGFLKDLLRLNCSLLNTNILIIGAGGATSGIIPPLLSRGLGVNSITIVNRTLIKALEIVNSSKDERLRAMTYEELSQEANGCAYQVIINATSLSIYNQLPSVSDALLSRAEFAYDLFYTKTGRTVFTEHMSRLGVKHCYDGLGMLVGQAALAYEQWFNVKADVDGCIEYMRQVLAQR